MTDQPLTSLPSRVRFPGGRMIKGQSLSGAPVELTVSEIIVVDKPKPGCVRVVKQDWATAGTTVQLADEDLVALLKEGIPEPMVAETETVASGFLPLTNAPFSGTPLPSDVNQGLIGDCRVISALQAIAVAQPALLTSALSGGPDTYGVALKRAPAPDKAPASSQRPEVFRVSGALPVNRLPKEPELLYCLRGNDTKDTSFPVWPAIFEKAFAVMWGGYGKLAGALEEPVMLALGLTSPLSSKIQLLNNAKPDPAAWREKMMRFHAENMPMTTTIQDKRHNYAIIRVSEDGVVVSDPNTRRTGDFLARWATPRHVSTAPGFVADSEVWPLFFPWDTFFDRFMWVYAYSLPT